MQNFQRKSAVAAHFDRSARLWEQTYEDDSGALPIQYRVCMKERLELVLETLDSFAARRALRVLDIGCGTGRLTRALAQRGHFAVGADFAPAMLERARLGLQAAGSPARLLRADAESLPFRKASFDVVCCLGLLEYLAGDEPVLGEIDYLLRQGGILIVTLPNIARLSYLLDPYYYAVRGVSFTVHKLGLRRVAESPTRDDVDGNQGFVVRRFLRNHLNRPLGARGYTLYSRAPVGFGPFTFWRRAVACDDTSVRWSRRLDQLCHQSGFRWLECFASRWVFAYVKESQ